MILYIKRLYAYVNNQEILKGVSLVLEQGKIYALMGPNGSGKSTLAKTIAGYPAYQVKRGRMLFCGQDILKLSPDKRACKGIFLAFQQPKEVPGVGVFEFLRAVYTQRKDQVVSVEEFKDIIKPILENLKIKERFLQRDLDGFSGGERKKLEVLQMAILRPKIIILDEIDSGLDIDALQTVSRAIKAFRPPDSALLIITHYQRILKYIKPDYVYVMIDGKIVASGGRQLAQRVEKDGYRSF